MIEWLLELWKRFFKKPDKPEPDKPEEPEGEEWANEAEGYRIRLKDYKDSPDRMHRGRKTSVKIDTRFHTVNGMDARNTRLFVDDGELVYYGVDAENDKHDLCFADMDRFPEDHKKPCYLKIYRNAKLHTVVKIAEWGYGTVYVAKSVMVPKGKDEL